MQIDMHKSVVCIYRRIGIIGHRLDSALSLLPASLLPAPCSMLHLSSLSLSAQRAPARGERCSSGRNLLLLLKPVAGVASPALNFVSYFQA